MLRKLPIIIGLVAACIAMPAYAKLKSGQTFKISRAAMVQFCNANGGVVTGGGHSGCDGLCGGGQICDADCVGNDCTVIVLVAKGRPHGTIPQPSIIGNAPPASLSTSGAGGGGSGASSGKGQQPNGPSGPAGGVN